MTESPIPTPNTQSPTPNYKWAIVAMLWFICFFNYADRVAISSVLPALGDEFHFSKTAQGWIASAFTWVYALTAPFAGQVGDRYPRKLIIIGGLYVWSLITGFTALCSKLWHFILVRGAEGLGETFYFPASMSILSDYHAKETRSRALSLHQTSVYAGTVGGGTIAGWMALNYGWRYPFVVFAVAGIVLGLFLARFIREPRRNEADRIASGQTDFTAEPDRVPLGTFLRELGRTPTAIILVIAFLGANSVALIFLTWMPTFLKEKFQLDLAKAGFNAVIYIQSASMVGALLAGVAADRWRNRHPGGRIRTQAIGLLIGAPFVFLCGWTHELAALIPAMIFFGLSKGIYDSNIWASLYDVVHPTRRGTAVGLMNLIGWVGGAIGPVVVGMAVDRGITMSAAISSTAVVYLMMGVLMFVGAGVFAPRDVERNAAAGLH